MCVAVDHLQVGPAPEVEELGPRQIALLAPDLEQGRAVVHFGGLPQPRTAGGTAPVLQFPQEPGVVAGCIPQLPGDDAGGVPDGILVGPFVPQVDMPAEVTA